MKNRAGIVAFALLVSAIPGCGEGPTEARSTIRVSVETSGGDIDNGYVLHVGLEKRVITSTASVAVAGFAPGPQSVRLEDVADNCTVAGLNPRVVDVVAGTNPGTTFEVTCDATGIEVEVITEATEYPFLGYEIRAAGQTLLSSPNGVVTFTRVEPGSHLVNIDAPASCSVVGGQPVSVVVAHRQVTRVTLRVACTRISNLIAFVLDSLASNTIRQWVAVTDAEGTHPTSVVPGYDPSWSAAGDRLTWSTTVCDYYNLGCSGGLSTRDLTTGVTLTPDAFRHGASPAWSPDGISLAFEIVASDFSGSLRVVAANGSIISINTPTLDARGPSWSPDGQQLAFSCWLDRSNADVCVMNRDGSSLARITSDPAYESTPAWSPDGRMIAISTTRGQPSTSVAVMKPDGTEFRVLTAGFDPAWSPDGSKIVFSRGDGLFIMNADGSAEKRITNGRHRAPTWRP